MSSARDLYEQARRRALARTGDPQHTTSTADPRLLVAELNRLCVCGHVNCLHTVGTRKGVPTVTACTVMSGTDGRCGCRLYTPSLGTSQGPSEGRTGAHEMDGPPRGKAGRANEPAI
jgi:hypothetical protein